MFYRKYLILVTSLLFATLLTNCIKNDGHEDNLFLADVKHDLNSFLKEYSEGNVNSYYLKDSLRGKDSISDIKFYYSGLLYFKMVTIDSLYKIIPGIFWNEEKFNHLDTMPYVNSVSIIEENAEIDQKIKDKLITIINSLIKIQPEIIKIKEEMEKLRPGTKKEKLNCQNCKIKSSSEGIKSAKVMSELYVEVEKQFVIVYRELACATFAIELIDVRKVATNSYKIRI